MPDLNCKYIFFPFESRLGKLKNGSFYLILNINWKMQRVNKLNNFEAIVL